MFKYKWIKITQLEKWMQDTFKCCSLDQWINLFCFFFLNHFQFFLFIKPRILLKIHSRKKTNAYAIFYGKTTSFCSRIYSTNSALIVKHFFFFFLLFNFILNFFMIVFFANNIHWKRKKLKELKKFFQLFPFSFQCKSSFLIFTLFLN